MMSPLAWLLAAVTGYLLGSLSFARLLGRWVLPADSSIETTSMAVPGSDKAFVLDGVSATSLSMRKRPAAGCAASLLDMAKAALPVWFFMAQWPDQPYFLVVAVAALIGHNFPLYHRFHGGRGVSPIFGGLFVIDWVSIPVTVLAGNLVGLGLLREVLLGYTAFAAFLIPWMWWRHDTAHLVYAVAINVVFWYSMRGDLRQYYALKRAGAFAGANLGASLRSGGYTAPLARLINRRRRGKDADIPTP